MIKKYRFRTSLGEVVILFDEDNLKEKWGFGWSENAKKTQLHFSDKVTIEIGKKEINDLYDCGYGYIIKKMQDGSLWFEVNLPNGGAYGSPEYLLEEVK